MRIAPLALALALLAPGLRADETHGVHPASARWEVGGHVCEVHCTPLGVPSEWTWALAGGRPSAWSDRPHTIESRRGAAWLQTVWRWKGAQWQNPWGPSRRIEGDALETTWGDPYHLRIVTRPRVEGRDLVVAYHFTALADAPRNEDGTPWLREHTLEIQYHPDLDADPWWLEWEAETGLLSAIRWPNGFDVELEPPLPVHVYYGLVLCEDRRQPPDCTSDGIYHPPLVRVVVGRADYGEGDVWSFALRFVHTDGVPAWHW